MRIVHTCLRYPPATGGVETYVRELVERTRSIAQNIDVRVLTSKMRTHGPITELNPDLLLDDPPYIQRLHHLSTPLISYPRLQALNYYLGHHQPDLLHGYSFWYQPADTAARWAVKHHRPFIFHPMYYESANRRKLSWQIYKKTIGYNTFAAADAVVVISPFEQELITQAGFPVKRFYLIPPGVDLSEFESAAPNPFPSFPAGTPTLLCVSRLSAEKGLQDIISVLPNILHVFPTARLFIVGEDFGYASQLRDQIKQLGLTSHVHLLGRLSRRDLISAYQHADLFIHPSHYEAFGIVIAEAIAARLPVIARDAAAIPYIAPHNHSALLFHNNHELTQHILSLIKHKELAHQLADNAYQRLLANFTWEITQKKVIDLYAEIIRTD